MTPPRFSTYELKGWDLSELLPQPTEDVISGRLAEIEEAVTAFEARRADLHPDMDPATFVEILRESEAMIERMALLGGYASLWFYADTSNQDALAFRNRVRTAMTTAGNRVLFFSLWWRALSDDEAERLLPQGAEHADQVHYLRDLRRFKPFTLDEKSEQIINIKDENGIGAVTTLYSMLTNRLEFKLEVDGESKTLTRDGLMAYAFSPKAEMRAAAYQELYRVYDAEATVLGQIYVNRVRDWYDENVTLRGYPSAIAVRNVDNDIPDEAVQVLLDV